MSKNIVLVGFMGAGKTLISARLAKKLKMKAVSTDAIITKKEKRAITDIFLDSGEPYFREIEKEAVGQVSRQKDVIVDCGGGVVLDPENMTELREAGIIFYLAATVDELFRRTKEQKHRPLLNTKNPKSKIEDLLDKRKSFYEQADYHIDTDRKTPEQVCDEIIAIWQSSQTGNLKSK